MNRTAVVAIGGNALTQKGQKGTVEEQIANMYACSDPIIDMVEKGWNVILTHGNGPQVGNILLKNEAAKNIVPPVPLDVCDAQTAGSIGYIISQVLENRMHARGIDKSVAVILSQVLVDENDPAFQNPTKPIGPFYTKTEAEELARTKGYSIVEDSGRGYRRVVPSPLPISILQKNAIRDLSSAGYLVVAVGGGGVPVVRRGNGVQGVETVIDKDAASALLAIELQADCFIILTGVEQVSINFGMPNVQNLSELTVADAERYMAEGQFPAGSMGPKIKSVCRYAQTCGGTAIITSIDKLTEAIEGCAGTRVTC